jgi:hypothetical protein
MADLPDHAFLIVLNGGGSGLVITVKDGEARVFHKPKGLAEDDPLTLLGTSPARQIISVANDIRSDLDDRPLHCPCGDGDHL